MRGRSEDEFTVLPSNLRITSEGSSPALSAGPPFSTELTSAPAAFGRPNDSASSLVTSMDDYADAAPADAPGRPKLMGDVHRHVDRNRERKTHEAAGTAVYLRIDADYYLALEIEQRAA